MKMSDINWWELAVDYLVCTIILILTGTVTYIALIAGIPAAGLAYFICDFISNHHNNGGGYAG